MVSALDGGRAGWARDRMVPPQDCWVGNQGKQDRVGHFQRCGGILSECDRESRRRRRHSVSRYDCLRYEPSASAWAVLLWLSVGAPPVRRDSQGMVAGTAGEEGRRGTV